MCHYYSINYIGKNYTTYHLNIKKIVNKEAENNFERKKMKPPYFYYLSMIGKISNVFSGKWIKNVTNKM